MNTNRTRRAAACLLLALAALLSGCGQTAVQPPAAPAELAPTEPPVVAEVVVTVAPTPTAEPTPTPTPTPEPTPSGIWGGTQEDKFTTGEEIVTEDEYRAQDVYVKLTTVTENTMFYRWNSLPELVYFVTDIYVQDASFIRLYCEKGDTRKFGDMVADVNAVVALTGDFVQTRKKGLIIRNGEVIREKLDPERDVCVLFRDGTMKVYYAGQVPLDEILANDPWQSWCFGPVLVEDGVAKTEFNTKFVASYFDGENPRAAIGYYEPGHYCLVQVDGRQEGYSIGLTPQNMALLMQELGCTLAYNLDGGATAQMSFQGKTISKQCNNRNPMDFVYIAYESAEDAAAVNALTPEPSDGETPAASDAGTPEASDGMTPDPGTPTASDAASPSTEG